MKCKEVHSNSTGELADTEKVLSLAVQDTEHLSYNGKKMLHVKQKNPSRVTNSLASDMAKML